MNPRATWSIGRLLECMTRGHELVRISDKGVYSHWTSADHKGNLGKCWLPHGNSMQAAIRNGFIKLSHGTNIEGWHGKLHYGHVYVMTEQGVTALAERIEWEKQPRKGSWF